MPVTLTPFYTSSDLRTACVKLSDAEVVSYSGFTANLSLLWENYGESFAIPTLLLSTVAGGAEIYLETGWQSLAGPQWVIYDPDSPPSGGGEIVDYYRTSVFLLIRPGDPKIYHAYFAFGPLEWSEGYEGTASVSIGLKQVSNCREFLQVYLHPELPQGQFMHGLYVKRWLAYDSASGGRRVTLLAYANGSWYDLPSDYYLVGADGRVVLEENVVRPVATSGGDPDVRHGVFHSVRVDCAYCGAVAQEIVHFTSLGGWEFSPLTGADALKVSAQMAAYGHPDEPATVELKASSTDTLTFTVDYSYAPTVSAYGMARRASKYSYRYVYNPNPASESVIADCEIVDVPTAKKLTFVREGAKWVSGTVVRYGDVVIEIGGAGGTTLDRATVVRQPTAERVAELLGDDIRYVDMESELSAGVNITQLSAPVSARLTDGAVQTLYEKYGVDSTCRRLLLKVLPIGRVYKIALKNNVTVYDFPSLHQAGKLSPYNCTLTVENGLLKVAAVGSDAYVDVVLPSVFFHRHLKLTGLGLDKVAVVGALDGSCVDWPLVLCATGQEGALDYTVYATTCAKLEVNSPLSSCLESYLDVVKYVSDGFPYVPSSVSWCYGWHKVESVRLKFSLAAGEHLYLSKLTGVYLAVDSVLTAFEVPAKRWAGRRMEEDGKTHEYYDERQLVLIADNRIALELKRAHTNWTSDGEEWRYFKLSDLVAHLEDPTSDELPVLAIPRVKLAEGDIDYFELGQAVEEQELVDVSGSYEQIEEPPKFQYYNVAEVDEYDYYYPPEELTAACHVPLCFLVEWTSAGDLNAEVLADCYYDWRGSGGGVVEYEIANLPEGAEVFGDVFESAIQGMKPAQIVSVKIRSDNYTTDAVGRYTDGYRLPKLVEDEEGWPLEVPAFNFTATYSSLANGLARVAVVGRRLVVKLFQRMRHNKAEDAMPEGFKYKLRS